MKGFNRRRAHTRAVQFFYGRIARSIGFFHLFARGLINETFS